MDLNNVSSNILLIGLVLIGLCCLYLLYSNFSKVREIEELKRKVEDLKKIFLNQQSHNEEIFSKINTVLYQTITNTPSDSPPLHPNVPSQHPHLHPPVSSPSDMQGGNISSINEEIAKEVVSDFKTNFIPETKQININTHSSDDTVLDNSTTITINKEGHVNSTDAITVSTFVNDKSQEKAINLELEDLDKLDEPHIEDDDPLLDELDDNCEEIEIDNLGSSKRLDELAIDDIGQDIEITKENIFSVQTIPNAEVFDDLEDVLSIATDPIGDSNEVINSNSNFNLDDIDDINNINDINDIDNSMGIDDIDGIDGIDGVNFQSESVQMKTINIDNSNISGSIKNFDTLELDEILNGNTSSSNHIKSNDDDNVKHIDIENSKTETHLQNMSMKQLKELAKSHKLKTTGTKQELINLLAKVI
jgi:hypothetical protein